MDNLAPVLLFVYNRPEHTKKTIEALEKNKYAINSDLYIFADGPKNTDDIENINKVRAIINDIQGFKNVNISILSSNRGLATSVISGVTSIINKYGKVIVLEDDLITSEYFLEYMNESLKLYQNNQQVWSISGYVPELLSSITEENNVFLAPRGCSWGWATWKDRWTTVDWDVRDYQTFKQDHKRKKEFNKGGNDLSFMLADQMHGRIDSWAIRWVYSQYKDSSYTVYPLKSLVRNCGLDFSGTHGSTSKKYTVNMADKVPMLTKELRVHKDLQKEFKNFYDLDTKGYFGVITRRLGVYRVLKKATKNFNRKQRDIK